MFLKNVELVYVYVILHVDHRTYCTCNTLVSFFETVYICSIQEMIRAYRPVCDTLVSWFNAVYA